MSVWQNGRVLITGASSGLGAAIAGELAAPGVRLLLIARNEARLAAVAESCRAAGAQVEEVVLDVSNSAQLVDFLTEADRADPIGAVFANAGIEFSVSAGQVAEPWSETLAQLRTNFEGAIATVQPLIEPMCRRGAGRIVLISSLAALMPLPDQPTYSASKAALRAYGEAIHPTASSHGVFVTVACPGFVETKMSEQYRGWRPFEWSAIKAAQKILKASYRGQRTVIFPWPLAILIGIGRSVPHFIRLPFVKYFFRVRIVK